PAWRGFRRGPFSRRTMGGRIHLESDPALRGLPDRPRSADTTRLLTSRECRRGVVLSGWPDPLLWHGIQQTAALLPEGSDWWDARAGDARACGERMAGT